MKYEIQEKFEISGRGSVVAIADFTARVPGKPYEVTLETVDGATLVLVAYKEYMRISDKVEKEAYTLGDLKPSQLENCRYIVFKE